MQSSFKYKNIFAKVYVQIGLKEFLLLQKLQMLSVEVISDRSGDKISGTFYAKELQKTKSKRI